MNKQFLLDILGEVQLWNMSTHEAAEKILKASNESLSVSENEAKQEKCCRCGMQTTTNSDGICYGCKALEID